MTERLTKSEQRIADMLAKHSPITGPQIARALGKTPNCVKVMICHMRQKGVEIDNGNIGPKSEGYRLA